MDEQNFSLLTFPEHLYAAFKHTNNLENYYGVVEFKNSANGLIWHVLFAEFCFDYKLEILKTGYEVWRSAQLIEKHYEYELFKNYSSFVIYDEASYLEVVNTIKTAIRQSNNYKHKPKNVKKTYFKNN